MNIFHENVKEEVHLETTGGWGTRYILEWGDADRTLGP